MKYSKILVSVVMPVRNMKPFIKEAVESVLSQSYKNFELIIVDDFSSDGTWEILKEYERKDKRIVLLRNKKHIGFGGSLNNAIKKAKGEYIARMDGDDVMVKTRLEEQVRFLRNNPDIVACGSWMYEMNEKGVATGSRTLPLKHKQIVEMMYYVMGMQHPTVMLNRLRIPKDFNWCSTKGLRIADDLDVLFRILKYGKFANIAKYLMYYRVHNENLSLKNIKETYKEASFIRDRAVQKYGYKPTLKGKIYRFFTSILITILPQEYILKTYSLIRGNK